MGNMTLEILDRLVQFWMDLE